MKLYILVQENGNPVAVYDSEALANTLLSQIEDKLNLKLKVVVKKLNLPVAYIGVEGIDS